VNTNTEFPITETEAAQVLEVERNEYFMEKHSYLKNEVFPRINDFKEFYVYFDGIRKDILGRVVAKYQNIVWSTGTHTNAPVPVVAYGNKDVTAWFSKMMHTTELGQYAINVLTKNQALAKK
jgi:alkaline phosphatase